MKHLVLVLGMMVVTYLPRLAPFILLRTAKLPVFLQRFLRVLPVCALGALLLPDLIDSIPGHPWAAAAGVVAAGAISLTRGGLLLSVIAGVGASYLMLF
ncbi:MAG: AzlD domain-containing protein [Spirochaetales bacterium]|jgi:branched-subunit amino acid transport protein|nr:AzlD domain-containing protein [Spirochaetales bacterium]